MWVHSGSVDLGSIGSRMFRYDSVDSMCIAMADQALKWPHGRFIHNHAILEQDDTDPSGFPVEWITDEMKITAGGVPVRWRPIWWAYDNAGSWALDLESDEYIDLWIEWAEDLTAAGDCSYLGVGLDNFGFNMAWYDPESGWDPGYPQSGDELIDAGLYFFSEVDRRSDVMMLVNMGSFGADEDRFPEFLPYIDAFAMERWPKWPFVNDYARINNGLKYIRRWRHVAAANKVGVIQSRHLESVYAVDESVLQALLGYIIVRGDNFFFAPLEVVTGVGTRPVALERYHQHQEALGWHLGDAVEVAEGIWTRECEGGKVLLNWSGSDFVFAGLEGYVSRDGTAITEHTVKAGYGDYVLRSGMMPTDTPEPSATNTPVPTVTETPMSTSTPTNTPEPTETPTAADTIIVNHTDYADQLTQAQLDAARTQRVAFCGQSIMINIIDGMIDLQTQDASRYSIGLTFDDTSNPGINYFACTPNGEIQAKMDRFGTKVSDTHDIAMQKFCVVDWEPWTTNHAPNWTDDYVATMDTIAAQHSNTTIVYWTIPLESEEDGRGLEGFQAYNDQLRAYVQANGGILFDIADIESKGGTVRADGYEALWESWSTGSSCHLNTPGRQRLASALWVLLAEVAAR